MPATLEGFHLVFGDVLGPGEPRLRYAWRCPEEDESGGLLGWRTSVEELGRGVFALSNENRALDAAWSKCEWLQQEVDRFLRELPQQPAPQVADVHAGLVAIMSRTDVPGLCPPPRLPGRFSPETEAFLHRGPFSPWRAEFPEFGTVSQRVLLSDARDQVLVYYHRSTNLPPPPASPEPPEGRGPVCGEWSCFKVPWLSSTASTVLDQDAGTSRRSGVPRVLVPDSRL